MAKGAAFVVLSMSLTFSLLLLTGGDACEDAPSMSAAAACQKASTGQAMRRLCADTLGGAAAPEQREVTAFVLAAANAAAASLDTTVHAIRGMVEGPSTPLDVRAAGQACDGEYDEARERLAAAVGHLRGCELPELIRDVPDAVAAVDDCATALLRVTGSSPMYNMVVADRDRGMLTLRLTSILLKHPGN